LGGDKEGPSVRVETVQDCTDPLVREALLKLASGELEFSSGPTDVEWTEEDKKGLNEALGRVFGWGKPLSDKETTTTELVDKVAKNIMRARMLDVDFFGPVYATFEDKRAFQEQFELAVNTVWNGTDPEDEAERTKYRLDALAALAVLGYHVELDDIRALVLV
jgi:hypothetical protein